MPNNAGYQANHPYFCPPKKANGEAPALVEDKNYEVAVRQTEALVTLSEGVKALAEFVTQGGLQALVAANAKGSIIQGIVSGLAAKDGRGALDARVLKQNSLEIVEFIEQVFSKMHERMSEARDPEIKKAEE